MTERPATSHSIGVLPAHWRVYPASRRGLYVEVSVWPSRQAMLRHLRRGGIVGHRMALGLTISDSRPQRRRPKWLASIYLVRKGADANTIAHEAAHAGLAYVARVSELRSLQYRGKTEELLAGAVGNITDGIAEGFRRLERAS